MNPRVACLVFAALLAPLAHADELSYAGFLDPSDPNDVFLASFTLLVPSALTIQTWSFGGGTNATGAAIAAGGFDPYVSLFRGAGAAATFIASNDDGLCPPGNGATACADSTLSFDLLAAGTYTLALTLPFNNSFAENAGSGTLGDGFIGLDSSFDDGSCAGSCSSRYAVDITYTPTVSAPVPEPAAWALMGTGSLLLALARRRAAGPVGTRASASPSTEEFA